MRLGKGALQFRSDPESSGNINSASPRPVARQLAHRPCPVMRGKTSRRSRRCALRRHHMSVRGIAAALRRLVAVFGAAWPRHAYLFANRMKVLVHDGIGVWLAALRLNAGRFTRPRDVTGTTTHTCAMWTQVRRRPLGPGRLLA